jgi:hypothetical protein
MELKYDSMTKIFEKIEKKILPLESSKEKKVQIRHLAKKLIKVLCPLLLDMKVDYSHSSSPFQVYDDLCLFLADIFEVDERLSPIQPFDDRPITPSNDSHFKPIRCFDEEN